MVIMALLLCLARPAGLMGAAGLIIGRMEPAELDISPAKIAEPPAARAVYGRITSPPSTLIAWPVM
jgi:hypothetical protein